ncbi:hypothetical protein IV500_06395 [Paeniglutamicibacter antarcticus]|uniref:Lipoprotein n=1 Tax=Arthrobacter terrae TaxID=2935737 RepID=A0A931G511_9MICC|nr:hypothetical protein [Arthrobacter terrae]MBG0739030.1 hypothetical protein [Arthrobacter terrae]
MLKKPIRAGAAIIGGVMLTATILTGCSSSPKITLDGSEVTGLDKAIAAADTSWAQQRAGAPKSNVDKDSRCYAQTTSDGVLVDKALCGPIHYLGADDQVWEEMDWKPSGDGTDKVQLSATDSFSSGSQPAANATLYRTDGKKAPDGLKVPEPDTKTSDAGQAIWGSQITPDTTPGISVVTPDVSMTLNNLKISNRVGSGNGRVKAGDGNRFASVDISTGSRRDSFKTELALVSGGKTYPAGQVQNGKLSMVLPGDGKDVALAVTFDGFTQKVTFADGKLETKATAFYDGYASQATAPKLASIMVGEDLGTHAKFYPGDFSATRTAYNEKAGWAPEGKAWLVLSGTCGTSSFENKARMGNGSIVASYTATTTVTSATVKNVSGTAFSSDATRIDGGGENNSDGSKRETTIVLEVPAGVGDFSVSLALNAAGVNDNTSSAAPRTVSLDTPVPAFDLTFKKK